MIMSVYVKSGTGGYFNCDGCDLWNLHICYSNRPTCLIGGMSFYGKPIKFHTITQNINDVRNQYTTGKNKNLKAKEEKSISRITKVKRRLKEKYE